MIDPISEHTRARREALADHAGPQYAAHSVASSAATPGRYAPMWRKVATKADVQWIKTVTRAPRRNTLVILDESVAGAGRRSGPRTPEAVQEAIRPEFRTAVG